MNPLDGVQERPIALVNYIRERGGMIVRHGGEIRIEPRAIVTRDLRAALEAETEGIVLVLAMEEWGRLWCLMDPEQFFRRH